MSDPRRPASAVGLGSGVAKGLACQLGSDELEKKNPSLVVVDRLT